MITVIAGTGNLPILACKSLFDKGKNFSVVTLFPKDNLEKLKKILPKTISIIAQPFYKVSHILKLLEENKTNQVLLIGKVDKRNLLKQFKLDWLAIKLLSALSCKSDTTIMNKIVHELEKRNIQIIPQNKILNSLLISPGILTGKLTKDLKKEIEFGLQTAKLLSHHDIGQTVIVKDKMILAVEAIEGTNECIKRGILLGKNNIIVCKTAHINQSKKFDLPTLGPQSLDQIKKNEIRAIAWQSSQTFISNKQEFIEKAKKLEITLVSTT